MKCVCLKLNEIDCSISFPCHIQNLCFLDLFKLCCFSILTQFSSSPPQQPEWDLYSVQTPEHHPGAFAELFRLPDASGAHRATCECCCCFLSTAIVNVTGKQCCAVSWTQALLLRTFLLFQLFMRGNWEQSSEPFSQVCTQCSVKLTEKHLSKKRWTWWGVKKQHLTLQTNFTAFQSSVQIKTILNVRCQCMAIHTLLVHPVEFHHRFLTHNEPSLPLFFHNEPSLPFFFQVIPKEKKMQLD